MNTDTKSESSHQDAGMAAKAAAQAEDAATAYEPPPFWAMPDDLTPRMELLQLAGKSVPVAYLLWFAGGPGGMHRFYLHRYKEAIIGVALVYISAILLIVLIGILGLLAAVVWWVVDAFRLPRWVNAHNRKVAGLMSQVGGAPIAVKVSG